jgi:hypothetical protein
VAGDGHQTKVLPSNEWSPLRASFIRVAAKFAETVTVYRLAIRIPSSQKQFNDSSGQFKEFMPELIGIPINSGDRVLPKVGKSL